MKAPVINALFLIFLSAFPGTLARTLPEHPSVKLIQLIQFRNFLGRKIDLGTNPGRTPPSPTSPSGSLPAKATSRDFPFYGKMAAEYGRKSSPPPPSPSSAPPTKEEILSITVAGYGRAASPPPPSPTSAPPTKEISFIYNGQVWQGMDPKSSPPTHQVSSIGLLLEKSPQITAWLQPEMLISRLIRSGG